MRKFNDPIHLKREEERDRNKNINIKWKQLMENIEADDSKLKLNDGNSKTVFYWANIFLKPINKKKEVLDPSICMHFIVSFISNRNRMYLAGRGKANEHLWNFLMRTNKSIVCAMWAKRVKTILIEIDIWWICKL